MPDPVTDLDVVARRLSEAIARHEWRGADPNKKYTYVANDGIGAMGKYNFIPSTLAADSRQYLGRLVEPKEFLSNPQLQDELAYLRTKANIEKNLKKYGSIEDSIRWTAIDHIGHNQAGGGIYAGSYNVKTKKRFKESPNDYANSVLKLYGMTPIEAVPTPADREYEPLVKQREASTMQPLDLSKYDLPFKDPQTPEQVRMNIRAMKMQKPLVDKQELDTATATVYAQVEPAPPPPFEEVSASAQGRVLERITKTAETAPIDKRQRLMRSAKALSDAMIAQTNGVAPLVRPEIAGPTIGAPDLVIDATGVPQPGALGAYQGLKRKSAQAAVKSGQIEPGDVVTSESGAVSSAPDEPLERAKLRVEYKQLQRKPVKPRGATQAAFEYKPEEVSEEEYVSQRERDQVRADLKKGGLVSKVLRASLDPKVSPSNDALTLGLIGGANALLGGVPSAISPEGYGKATGELRRTSKGAGIVSETGGNIVGMLLGIKGASKLGGPLLQRLGMSDEAILAHSATWLQTPSELIQVAKGDKDITSALGDLGSTFAQFRTIGPIIRGAEKLGREVAAVPSLGEGAGIAAARTANVAAQTVAGTAGTLVGAAAGGRDVTMEDVVVGAVPNVLLSVGDVSKARIKGERPAPPRDITGQLRDNRIMLEEQIGVVDQRIADLDAAILQAEARGDGETSAQLKAQADELMNRQQQAKADLDGVIRDLGVDQEIKRLTRRKAPTDVTQTDQTISEVPAAEVEPAAIEADLGTEAPPREAEVSSEDGPVDRGKKELRPGDIELPSGRIVNAEWRRVKKDGQVAYLAEYDLQSMRQEVVDISKKIKETDDPTVQAELAFKRSDMKDDLAHLEKTVDEFTANGGNDITESISTYLDGKALAEEQVLSQEGAQSAVTQSTPVAEPKAQALDMASPEAKAVIDRLPVNTASTAKQIKDYAIRNRIPFDQHESWGNILQKIQTDAVTKALSPIQTEQYATTQSTPGGIQGDQTRSALNELTRTSRGQDIRPDQGEVRQEEGRQAGYRDRSAEPSAEIIDAPSLAREIGTKFGLDESQSNAVAAIADARAESWSSRTGKDKSEWYKSRIASVEKGGTPGEGALYQGENAPAFYSALDKFVEGIPQEKLSVEQLKGQLAKTPGIKAEEVNWRGLDTYLEGKKSVTKQDLLDYLADNEVEIREVNVGDKYEEYTLPGGENYRELLLTMPNLTYADPHFPELRGTVAHVRATDRIIDGKRTLMLEEIQSGVHQAGRKQGYDLSKAERSKAEARVREIESLGIDYNSRGETTPKELIDEWVSLKNHLVEKGRGVPDAPFKKTWHELAMKKMLDKAVREGYDQVAWTSGEVQNERYDLSKQVQSVEYGGDTGITLKAYDSNDARVINEEVPRDKLADYVGKDVAKKLLASLDYNLIMSGGAIDMGRLEGQQLSIGGSGMKGFYDKMLPEFANKYLKKYGVKASQYEAKATIDNVSDFTVYERAPANEYTGQRDVDIYDLEGNVVGGRFGTRKTNEEILADFARNEPSAKDKRMSGSHVIPITSEMRSDISSKGQPLFQGKKASVEFLSDGRAVIRALESPDVSSAVHELGHIFRRDLEASDLAIAEKWANVKDGKWNEYSEERFARGFERYLQTGYAPSEGLRGVFSKFKDWLSNIYQKIKGGAIDVKIPAEMRSVYDRLLVPDGEVTTEFSRVPPKGSTAEAGALHAKLLELTQEGNNYNPRGYKPGEKMYRYTSTDAQGAILEFPNYGVIRLEKGVPVFYDQATKKTMPIDESIMRRGEAHPLTSIDTEQQFVPYLIGKMAQSIAKSFNSEIGFKVFKRKNPMGFFKGRRGDVFGADTEIGVQTTIFADPNQLARKLSHEVGHLDDYAGPDTFTTRRGSLVDRVRLAKESMPVLNKDFRAELEALTREWTPFDPSQDKGYTDYRYSPHELYAEFVSTMLVNPELTARLAPKFLDAYNKKLAERPQMREALESLRKDLDPNNTDVWDDALAEDMRVQAESIDQMRDLQKRDMEAAKNRITRKPMQNLDIFNPTNKEFRDRETKAYKLLKKEHLHKDYKEFIKYRTLIEQGSDADKASSLLQYQKQLSRIGDVKMNKLWEARALMGGDMFQWHAGRAAISQYRISSEAQAAIADDVEQVMKPLRDMKVGETNAIPFVSKYLELTAVTGTHRGNGVANPNFENATSAQSKLDAMRRRVGEQAYQAIQESAQKFRDLQFDVLTRYKEAGLISDEKLTELEANKDSYARYQSILDENLRPHYSREGVGGMLSATRDVAVTGTLQMMTMEHAIRLNNAKKVVVDVHGGKPAKIIRPNIPNREARYERPKNGYDIVEVWDNGQRKGYIVDQYIADIFNKAPFENENVWGWYTTWMNFQRANLITLNPNFIAQNPFRDIRRMVTNLGYESLLHIPQAARAGMKLGVTADSHFGRGLKRVGIDLATPIGDEAGKSGALNYRSRSNWLDGASPTDKVLKTAADKEAYLRRIWNTTKRIGMYPLDLQEAIPKIAAYDMLRKKGRSMGEAAYYARTHVGTPDGTVSGYWSQKMNRAFIFSKMWSNAWMSTGDVVRNPFTRKGVIARSVVNSVIPKTVQGLLARGLISGLVAQAFGKDSEEYKWFDKFEGMYAAVPDYDLQRYNIIPEEVYADDNGNLRVKYTPIADDQNSTAVANVLLNIVDGIARGDTDQAIGDNLRNIYGDAPGMAPLLDAGLAWLQYAFTDQNPYDRFRDRNVIPQQEFDARTPMFSGNGPVVSDATKTMAEYTLGKIFGSNYTNIKNAITSLSKEQDPLAEIPSTRFMYTFDTPAYKTGERKVAEAEEKKRDVKNLETSKILASDDLDSVQQAFKDKAISARQYRDYLKKKGWTDQQIRDDAKPLADLIALQTYNLKMKNVPRVQQLQKIIDRKRTKLTRRTSPYELQQIKQNDSLQKLLIQQ